MGDITRDYGTSESAERALAKLRAEGLADEEKATVHGTGAEAKWRVSIRPPFGTGMRTTEILDSFGPATANSHYSGQRALEREYPHERSDGVSGISGLSGPVSPGAISSLSGRVAPGAIAAMSGPRPVGAIASFSGHRSSGSIARLSGRVSPGSISRLSRTGGFGDVSRLSSGWYVSRLFGLPLLTKSQSPIEPDASLLTDRQEVPRR